MGTPDSPPPETTMPGLLEGTNKRIEKIEERLEKLERGQAISQYFFKLMSDQNKEMLKDGKSIVNNTQDIIDAMGKFEELCENWDDSHPLMEAATKFTDYVMAKMKEIDPQGQAEPKGDTKDEQGTQREG